MEVSSHVVDNNIIVCYNPFVKYNFSMESIITIAQVAVAIVLMALILLQNRGGGLSSVFGGGDSSNVFRTKRGMEKTIFILTIIFSILFLGVSIANILIRA